MGVVFRSAAERGGVECCAQGKRVMMRVGEGSRKGGRRENGVLGLVGLLRRSTILVEDCPRELDDGSLFDRCKRGGERRVLTQEAGEREAEAESRMAASF